MKEHKIFFGDELLKYIQKKEQQKEMLVKIILSANLSSNVAPQQSLIPCRLTSANFKWKNDIYQLSKSRPLSRYCVIT